MQTFHILTESGNSLLTENGIFLVLESIRTDLGKSCPGDKPFHVVDSGDKKVYDAITSSRLVDTESTSNV